MDEQRMSIEEIGHEYVPCDCHTAAPYPCPQHTLLAEVASLRAERDRLREALDKARLALEGGDAELAAAEAYDVVAAALAALAVGGEPPQEADDWKAHAHRSDDERQLDGLRLSGGEPKETGE